jgi:hypothetical protein
MQVVAGSSLLVKKKQFSYNWDEHDEAHRDK